MTKETFKVIVQPDSTEVLIQAINEIDKNHGPDDTGKTNDAKVFSTNGKYFLILKKLTKIAIETIKLTKSTSYTKVNYLPLMPNLK